MPQYWEWRELRRSSKWVGKRQMKYRHCESSKELTKEGEAIGTGKSLRQYRKGKDTTV